MKNVLVISQHAPFDDQHIRESLDMALIFAAIDQNISWLLSADAVLALKKKYLVILLFRITTIKCLKCLKITTFACYSY